MATRTHSGETPHPPSGEMRYADALASELIRHLGVDAAERTCAENHWGGVLDAVRRQSSAKSSPA